MRIGEKAYDIEGNEIPVTKKINGTYVLEPKQGILTDDEILKYAYKSNVAAEIRLKKGIGTFEDKKLLYGNSIFEVLLFGFMFVFFIFMFGLMFSNLIIQILGVILFLIVLSYLICCCGPFLRPLGQ